MINIKIKINDKITLSDFLILKKKLEISFKKLLQNYGINSNFKLEIGNEHIQGNEIILFEVNNIRIWSPLNLACYCWYYSNNTHVHELKTDNEILEEIKKEKAENIKANFLNDYIIETAKLSIWDFINDDVLNDLQIKNVNSRSSILTLSKKLLQMHISINKFKDKLKNDVSEETLIEDIIQECKGKDTTIIFSKDYFIDLTNEFDEQSEGKIFKTIDELLFSELGVDFPDVKFVTEELPYGFFKIKINDYESGMIKGLNPGEAVIQEKILPDSISVINPATNAEWWIIPSDQFKKISPQPWYPFSFIGFHLIKYYRNYAYLFIDRNMVKNNLADLEYTHPALIKVLKSKRDIDFVCKVFRALVEEGISLRNFETIFQSIIDFDYVKADGMHKIVFDWRLATFEEPDELWKNDPEVVAEFVRMNLKNCISSKLTNSSYSLSVYLMDPEIEQMVISNNLCNEEMIAKIMNSTYSKIEKFNNIFYPILTTIEVRKKLKRVIEKRIPELNVVSYQELAPSVRIDVKDRISLP